MPRPTKINGHYEAAACVTLTTADKNATCTEQLYVAEQEAIRNGATCHVQTEHLLSQNTGRVSTLWSLICFGPVEVPAAEPSDPLDVVPGETAETP